jgi:hypothetical protein
MVRIDRLIAEVAAGNEVKVCLVGHTAPFTGDELGSGHGTICRETVVHDKNAAGVDEVERRLNISTRALVTMKRVNKNYVVSLTFRSYRSYLLQA